MELKHRLSNIKKVYSHKESWPITIASALVMGYIFFLSTHIEQIWWNMGKLYTIAQITVQVLLVIFFGLNIALLWHKLKFAAKVNHTAEQAGSTILGSVLSILVSGCPACGLTIASYLGIATLFTGFPLFGLELKILGLLLLTYSILSLSKNMYVCKTKLAKA